MNRTESDMAEGEIVLLSERFAIRTHLCARKRLLSPWLGELFTSSDFLYVMC